MEHSNEVNRASTEKQQKNEKYIKVLLQALNYPFHFICDCQGLEKHKIVILRGLVSQERFTYSLCVLEGSHASQESLPIGAKVSPPFPSHLSLLRLV